MRPLLRPPLWARACLVIVVAVLLLGAVPVVVASASDGQPVVLGLGVLALLLGGLLAVRRLRTGVHGSADVLVVRNLLHDRRLPRAEVQGFRTGTNRGRGRCVLAVTVRELVALDVTTRSTRTDRARRRLERDRAVLERWLAEPGP